MDGSMGPVFGVPLAFADLWPMPSQSRFSHPQDLGFHLAGDLAVRGSIKNIAAADIRRLIDDSLVFRAAFGRPAVYLIIVLAPANVDSHTLFGIKQQKRLHAASDRFPFPLVIPVGGAS